MPKANAKQKERTKRKYEEDSSDESDASDIRPPPKKPLRQERGSCSRSRPTIVLSDIESDIPPRLPPKTKKHPFQDRETCSTSTPSVALSDVENSPQKSPTGILSSLNQKVSIKSSERLSHKTPRKVS